MNGPRIYAVGEDPAPLHPSPTPSASFDPTPKTPKGSASSAKRRVARERFQVLNAFVDFTVAELTPAEIIVWLILYRDTRGDSATVSMRDIARRAGRSLRAVETAAAKLERRGLLKVVRRGGFRRGVSTYRVQPLIKSDSQ